MIPRLVPLAAAALVLAAAPLRAQGAPSALPDSGARVRVTLVDRTRIVGRLVRREPDGWLVRRDRGDLVAITPPFVDALDVSRGELSPEGGFGRGARSGALAGGVFSLALGAVLLAQEGGDCDDCMTSPVLAVGILGGGLTLATTLVGGILGSQQRERWERVALPADARLGLVATPHGPGVAVRLALR